MNSAVKTSFRAAVAALVVIAGSTTALADDIELSIGSTARWMHSSSIDAVSADDSNAAFAASVAVSFDRITLPGVNLYFDASFEKSSLEGVAFERIDSETSITSYSVGVRAQRKLPYLPSRLSAFGRANLGAARVSLRLSDALSRADPMHDQGWAGLAHLGGGLDLMVIPKSKRSLSPALGLRAEVGYTASARVALDARAEGSGDDGAITIPTVAAPLGELDVSAWTLNVGLVGRF